MIDERRAPLLGLRLEDDIGVGPILIGIAFATQEVAEVPATPRDARLDLVLTERDVIDCRGT